MLLNFKEQFVQKILSGFKRHTIRAKRKRRPRVGETCHLYTGLRQKGARLLGRFECLRVDDIVIRDTNLTGFMPRLKIWINGEVLDKGECEKLAKHDGFADFRSMAHFWAGRLPFEGDMIHWNPDVKMAGPKERASKRKARKDKHV